MTLLNHVRRCVPVLLFSGLLFFQILQSTALAAITETLDQMTLIPAPASVQVGALESDTQVFVFEERANMLLSVDVAVDVTAPGMVPLDPINLSPGVISAGTYVSSYLVHFDVVGSPMTEGVSTLGHTNTIVFDHPVLGIQILSDSLDAGDVILGAPSTLYPIGESVRGLELSPGQIGSNAFDGITLSEDRMSLTAQFSTLASIDQLRILTAAVPEPTSLFLVCSGAAAMAGWCLRRRYSQRT